ncbi:hypothetical protein HZA55_00670 [Candidatus Poribacteria bacterium]|nr:hypothetical protein [Candidatus Poribacteria bacterium]
MAKNDIEIVAICDAGPIIHLDELDALYLLDFYSLIISKTVQTEITKHRPDALRQSEIKIIELTSHIDTKQSVLFETFSLDRGEQESLILIQKYPNSIFLTDDAAALVL